MQRGSDIAFLRMLARRSGKVLPRRLRRQPGVSAPATSPRRPRRRSAVANLAINDDANWTVNTLDLDWDATRPTAVTARTALFSDADPDAANGDTDDSGLAGADPIDLVGLRRRAMTVLLATAVDSAGDLTQRAQGRAARGRLVRHAARPRRMSSGWASCCAPACWSTLAGIGALHSGTWIVWTVRHRLTEEKHIMHFTLLRNAVGAPPTGRRPAASPT